MKEKDLQSQVTRSIRRVLIEFYGTKNFVYHKLSDESSDQKPSDMMLMYNGKGWIIELKLHKKPQAFAFDKVETHQIDAMTKSDASGNKGVLMVGVNLGRKRGDQFICIFDIKTWNKIVETSTKKSIKVEDMKLMADEVIYKNFKTLVGDNVWDFRNLFRK